jgi:hypothetical protein
MLLPVVLMAASSSLSAQVGVSVDIAPPELPIYEQPLCPGDGYMWTPGYWAWGNDYYWVPGTWVMPPEVGFLWTPAYWGWGGSGFQFYDGYWGESVGFYGGIDYGYGYGGRGYNGGRWNHGRFDYNESVNNVGGRGFHNVYNERVNDSRGSRVSFNGGTGGVDSRPSREEEVASHQRHIAPLATQTQHAEAARNDPQQRFSANRGSPAVAATSRPGAMKEGARASSGEAAGRAEASSRDDGAVHPRDLSPLAHPAAPSTGDKKLDEKYQKQQDKMVAQQNKQRDKLEQSQEREDREDREVQRQSANQARSQQNQARTQQTEQRHQQQTQQMRQGHEQQAQHMEQRQSSGGGSRGGGSGGRH